MHSLQRWRSLEQCLARWYVSKEHPQEPQDQKVSQQNIAWSITHLHVLAFLLIVHPGAGSLSKTSDTHMHPTIPTMRFIKTEQLLHVMCLL